jgi:hypothetical protein
MSLKRIAMAVGAVVCLALAAVFILLAVDIGRWSEAMAADDVRYRAEPESEDLWQPDTVLPFGVAARVLGTRDDVAFREAVRALRLSRLDLGITSDPELALRRGEARARLQQVAGEDGDPIRRSRATNLIGVIGFASSLSEARDQAAFIADAVAAFQTAIELDPDNREAKANLELALQRGRTIQPTESGGGPNPSPGGSGAKGAGAGDPGSGY